MSLSFEASFSFRTASACAEPSLLLPLLPRPLACPTGRSLSLTIQASFKTSSPLPAWVTARPMLLVANSADSDVSTALLRTRLQDADTTYSLTVDAAQVCMPGWVGEGWRVVVGVVAWVFA